jgi:hypothetical protein
VRTGTHTDKLVTEFHICRCMVCSDFEAKAEHPITGSQIVRRRKALVIAIYDGLQKMK